MKLTTRAIAEAIGTFWLVFGGCGAAVLACGVPTTGIGYVGVSLAFGLTVLTMAYAIGHISGCHLYNGAVVVRKKRTFRETKQKETLISVSCYF